jgi:hypothetical protein
MEPEPRKFKGCGYDKALNECYPVTREMMQDPCKIDDSSKFDTENLTCSIESKRRKHEKPPEPITKPPEPITKMLRIRDDFFVSGPISSYFFEHNGIKYFLYGDQHFSKENNCDKLFSKDVEGYEDIKPPCVTTTRGRDENDVNCYDLIAYLDRIFKNAERTDKNVDFYIELPFLVDDAREQDHDDDIVGYINSIKLYFRKCFTKDKKDCKFKNVHFHYADLRQPNEILAIPGYDLFGNVATLCEDIKEFLNSLINLKIDKLDMMRVIEDKLGGKEGRTELSFNIEYINVHVHAFFDENYLGDKLQPSIFENIIDAIIGSDNFKDALENIQDRYIKDVNSEVKRKLDMYATTDLKNKYLEEFANLTESITKKWDNMLSATSQGKHRVAKSLKKLDNDMSSQIQIYIKNEKKKTLEKIKKEFVSIWNRFYSNIIKLLYARQTSELFIPPNLTMINNIQTLQDFTSVGSEFVGTLIMDIYLLARMFYQNSIQRRNGRKTDTVIIFAGATHIENYIRFFKSLNRPPETIWEDYPEHNKPIIQDLRDRKRSKRNWKETQRCVRTPRVTQ